MEGLGIRGGCGASHDLCGVLTPVNGLASASARIHSCCTLASARSFFMARWRCPSLGRSSRCGTTPTQSTDSSPSSMSMITARCDLRHLLRHAGRDRRHGGDGAHRGQLRGRADQNHPTLRWPCRVWLSRSPTPASSTAAVRWPPPSLAAACRAGRAAWWAPAAHGRSGRSTPQDAPWCRSAHS